MGLMSWLKGRLGGAPAQPATPSGEAEALARRRRQAELDGMQLQAGLERRVVEALKDERGVHMETLFNAYGALAGFACQMALRDAFIRTGKATEQQIFITLGLADGQTFYTGDNLNGLVAESEMSIWKCLLPALQAAGMEEMPDILALFKQVISTVGSDTFGAPTTPAPHQPHEKPLEALRRFWPEFYREVREAVEQRDFPPMMMWMAPVGAAAPLIVKYKQILPPAVAARIIMEAAIAMSKIPPAWVEQQADG